MLPRTRLVWTRWLLCLAAATASAADHAAFAIVEKIAGAVGFYTAEGKRIAGAKVGAYPHEIVLSADKKSLYVSDNGILWMTNPGAGGNTISIVDLASMKRVGVIDLGPYRRPHGLDIDPRSGLLVATIENPDGLLLIDPVKRKVLRKFDVQGADPHMVIFDAQGEYAIVSNTATATLAAVNLRSGAVKLMPTDARPQGAVRSHDGKLLYVTNAEGHSITIYDLARKQQIGRIATGRGPARIVLTPDGKTLVYNLGEDNAVGFADVAARKQIAVVAIGGRPLSLTASADGRFAYAGIQDQDRVVVISIPERKIARSFETPKGSGPDPVLPLP